MLKTSWGVSVENSQPTELHYHIFVAVLIYCATRTSGTHSYQFPQKHETIENPPEDRVGF